MKSGKLKIGILGSRGIPNNYGGFEQFAEMLSTRLQKKGHFVSVYCPDDHPLKSDNFNGVQRIICKNPERKIGTAGQFLYDLYCILDSRKRKFDVLLLLGYTSSAIWSFLLPSGSVIISNMDGLEWQRSKYSGLIQKFLKYSEGLAARKSDLLIADSPGIEEHLKKNYALDSHYIPYSASIVPQPENHLISAYITSQEPTYDLLIARMEPENNIDAICSAYTEMNQKKLYVVGNCDHGFGSKMKAIYNSDKIVFLGAIYDQKKLNALRYYSRAYIHGHSVGGTNPSLLEAMACGCNIIAHDNQFNRAILGHDAQYFHAKEDLLQLLIDGLPHEKVRTQIENNKQKIRTDFSEATVVDAYEKLFLENLNA